MTSILATQATAQVSSGAIAGMVLSMLLCTLGPIVLLIIWRVKKKCNLMPALVGALTFIVFALILESFPKMVLLSGTNAISNYILNHAWAYALVGGLLAGIFEESGRFIAYRFFLKKHTDKVTAITYGIGHGGIESIILVGMGMLSNLSMAMLINSGALVTIMENLPAEQATAYETAIASLTSAGFGMFLWGIFERIFAILLHISLSVLVYASIKDKSRFYLFPLAIVLHAGLDVFAALYQFGTLTLPLTELCIALFASGCAVFAFRIYRNLPAETMQPH